MNENPSRLVSKLEEWKAFFFICVVFFPLLAIASVGGYGFIIWALQVFFFGPPSVAHG